MRRGLWMLSFLAMAGCLDSCRKPSPTTIDAAVSSASPDADLLATDIQSKLLVARSATKDSRWLDALTAYDAAVALCEAGTDICDDVATLYAERGHVGREAASSGAIDKATPNDPTNMRKTDDMKLRASNDLVYALHESPTREQKADIYADLADLVEPPSTKAKVEYLGFRDSARDVAESLEALAEYFGHAPRTMPYPSTHPKCSLLSADAGRDILDQPGCYHCVGRTETWLAAYHLTVAPDQVPGGFKYPELATEVEARNAFTSCDAGACSWARFDDRWRPEKVWALNSYVLIDGPSQLRVVSLGSDLIRFDDKVIVSDQTNWLERRGAHAECERADRGTKRCAALHREILIFYDGDVRVNVLPEQATAVHVKAMRNNDCGDRQYALTGLKCNGTIVVRVDHSGDPMCGGAPGVHFDKRDYESP